MHSTRIIPLWTAAMLLTLLAISCAKDTAVDNIALRKPAYHSSAADFNLTAQLAVDGIFETKPPCRVEVCGNGGVPLGKIEHDLVFEPRPWTAVTSEGPHAELSVRTIGFTEPVDAIKVSFSGRLPQSAKKQSYTAEIQRFDNGSWQKVKSFSGTLAPWTTSVEWKTAQPIDAQGWRFVADIPGAESVVWQELGFYREGKEVSMVSADRFSSVWMSAGAGQEWLAVDLGADSRFSEVRLHWLNAPSHGRLQAGADSSSWRDIAEFSGEASVRCDTLKVQGRGRWVRIQLDASVDGSPYILSEMEVMGKVSGRTGKDRNGRPDGEWTLARLDQAGIPEAWIPATVPGTVLASYLDNGMLPDPNYSDNQQYISDSYFRFPFIYRWRFDGRSHIPGKSGERTRLHFDGINWKADVVLNGSNVGRIEGAFTDASFDITDLIAEKNVLEVTVYPPAHPGMTKYNTLERCATNGGVLGADNPTFHASIGWDWIPPIRGRNMGIWNDVWLERHGPVRILDPHASSEMARQESLPPIYDTTEALVTLEATLVNESQTQVETLWSGTYGDIPFSVPVSLNPGESKRVSTCIKVEKPRLWWPNGYGEPALYDVKMSVGDSHSIAFTSGIRALDYDLSGNNLRIWINGRRLVGRGGNWGFSESNLRYRADDYQTAMTLHRHENFNLVRNWVGMTADEEFYEAADRCGILVWQDFWLANPADGPDPDDEALFMANAENMLLRIRNHPSLLLWCGRNEGYPPETLDNALRALVEKQDPESIYISSSADGPVTGRGPYGRQESIDYFRMPDEMFHSERGMPNFPNYESLITMMPADKAWPPSDLWGIHDFAVQSAQQGGTFIAAVEKAFGPSPDAETFASRAQWINYDGYRAMFEGRSRNRRGLLLWMSHPAWPSMAFCTYDWYLDCTASYYACRKACEPLHVQWNPLTEQVEVVNTSAGAHKSLRIDAELCNLRGDIVSVYSADVDSYEDSTIPCLDVPIPRPDALSEVQDVYLLHILLYEGEEIVSHNDYVLGSEPGNLKALLEIPEPTILTANKPSKDGRGGSVLVANVSDTPALMVHLTARTPDGRRILPTLWSDNYIHLMPGEETILDYTFTGPAGKDVEIGVDWFK